jgi:LAO/AO transport system ATPase
LVSQGEQLEAIAAGTSVPAKPGRVVALTGSAGVGKSTLIGKLIDLIRKKKQTVAVLACDPQSPLSGGALLGDRYRMSAPTEDEGVFIRSLAAASGHGAVAEHLDSMVRLLEAAGFDVILIETVGAGQGDTAVRDSADVLVLLLQPQTGDDLQWEKAGVLEVADVVAIHKADLPQAEQVESQVRANLSLSSGPEVPVLRVSSKTGEGMEALWETIAACPQRRTSHSGDGRDLLHLAQDRLAAKFSTVEGAHQPDLNQLITDWQQGRIGQDEAAEALLRLLQANSAHEINSAAH